MLNYTLSTQFEPGTNLRGEGAGAAWTFLLPSLDLRSILCVGAPSAATLAALSRLAGDVTVASLGVSDERRARRAAAEARRPIRLVRLERLEAEPEARYDLLVASRRAADALRRRPALVTVLRRALDPDGAAFVDSPSAVRGLGRPVALALAPRRGEVRAAAPEGSPAAAALVPARDARLATLALPHGAGEVPEYVHELARAAALDLDGMRVALSAPGEYVSRKVLLLLFADGAAMPTYVVKATRDPSLNGRLRNEWDALRALADVGLRDGVVPTPHFFGEPGGLAVLGQSAVDGAPYRSRMAGEAGLAVLRDAVGTLRDLAARTAHALPAAHAAVAFDRIAHRFVELYDPHPGLRDFLQAQVEAVRESAVPFPLVFQHGDPGTWNLLAADDGRVAFLDWESAEPDGVPLWDLFYLVRSHAVSALKAAGERDSLVAFDRQLVRDGELSALLADAVAEQREALGLDPALVGPLFHLCWAHRALKEATRLPARGLGRSHYARLLRLCGERTAAPGLRRVLTA
jgi:hypothetical protein